MDANDKVEFRVAIEALFAGFDREATTAMFLAYWMGLQDMRLSEVQEAVAMAMQRSRHLPKPIELRELVRGTEETRGELAWLDVLSATALGPYKHLDFVDSGINAAIRSLGGWPTFLSRFTDSESEKWARQEFLRAYRGLSRVVSAESSAPLPGLSEMATEPVRVGGKRLGIAGSNQKLIGGAA
jgi:hypothetical protein